MMARFMTLGAFILVRSPGYKIGFPWVACSAGDQVVVDEPKKEPDDSAALMYVKCAYCGKWMDVKPGHLHWVSHGLCDDCLAKEMEKIRPPTDANPDTPPGPPAS
jgi:hypothetical protein